MPRGSSSSSSSRSSSSLPSADYYALLNLSPSASLDDIRQSYRLLSCFHPDKLGSGSLSAAAAASPGLDAAASFLRIQRAFSVLSSPLLRWAYDRYGEEGVAAAAEQQQRIRLDCRTDSSARAAVADAVLADRSRAPVSGQEAAVAAQQDERQQDSDVDDDDDEHGESRGAESASRALPAPAPRLSGSSRVVCVLRAFSLFGYSSASQLPSAASSRLLLPFDRPRSYYSLQYVEYHKAMLSSALQLLSFSLRQTAELRLSDSLQLTAEATLESRAQSVDGSLAAGLKRRWGRWQVAGQLSAPLGSGRRSKAGPGLSLSGGWQQSQESRVELEAKWALALPPSAASSSLPLPLLLMPASTSLSFHHSLPSASSTTLTVSGSAAAPLSSVEWSVSSFLFNSRRIEQELTVSADSERLTVEERMQLTIGRRRNLKAFIKLAITAPHRAPPLPASDSSPAPPLSSLARLLQPALSVGCQYHPSSSQTLVLWLSASGSGVAAGLSYRLPSFSLTLPVQLTPEFSGRAALAGSLLPLCLLVVSRAAWRQLDGSRRRARWQTELNEAGLRRLRQRAALLSWLRSLRPASRRVRRQQRACGGPVVQYARLTFDSEGGTADPALPSAITVTEAVQTRLLLEEPAAADGVGVIRMERALDVLDGSGQSVELGDGCSLFVRWSVGGRERMREWRAEERVCIGRELRDEDAAATAMEEREGRGLPAAASSHLSPAAAASSRKVREAYERMKEEEESGVWAEDDCFW